MSLEVLLIGLGISGRERKRENRQIESMIYLSLSAKKVGKSHRP